jgi:geranylgeranyl reductase family protein
MTPRRTPAPADLVIVGAGPAGAAAALGALRAAPSLSVVLLDAAAFPRDKCCGDGVAGEAVTELAGLGVPGGGVAGCPPTTRLRVAAPSGRLAARPLRAPVWTVRRSVFDARLVEAAVAAGAELRRMRVVEVRDDGDRVELTGSRHLPADRRTLTARVVIGADGAHSVVARAVGAAPARAHDTGIAVRGYAPSLPTGAGDEPPAGGEQRIDISRAARPSYLWRFPVGDGTDNVGYGCRRDRLTGGRDALHGVLARELAGPPPDPETLRAAHLPFASGPTPLGRGRLLLAGDAARLVNPLTGEGIYYAIVSGRLAGESVADHGAGAVAAYRTRVRRRLGRHLRHAAVLSRVVGSERLVDAVIAAAARDAGCFDDVITLGLADGVLTPRLAAGAARALALGA